MNLPFFISRRYLLAPKTTNVINIITWVSIVGIAVGTTAMILVLSVFNGLTGLIENLFSAMDSDLRIEAKMGQTLPDSDSMYQVLKKHPAIRVVSKTIEGKAGLKYIDRQAQAIIKGVDDEFTRINPLDSAEYLFEGSYNFSQADGMPKLLLGSLVAENLNANLNDKISPIHVFVKTNGKIVMGNPLPSFKNEIFFPIGYFSVQKEYDEKYVLTDLETARTLFDLSDKITAYEIGLKSPESANKVKVELQNILGNTYKVLTLPDRHETLYKVMRNEKYISYLILLLLISIAAINIIGSLSMIVVEKTKDIAILKTMGISDKGIRNIFLAEGLWVGGIGVGIGLFLGITLTWLQMNYGFYRLSDNASFRFQALPVKLVTSDILLVFISVLFLAISAAIYPSIRGANISITEGLRK